MAGKAEIWLTMNRQADVRRVTVSVFHPENLDVAIIITSSLILRLST